MDEEKKILPSPVTATGYAFLAKLKARNQITVDSNVVDLLDMEEGQTYQLLLVRADKND